MSAAVSDVAFQGWKLIVIIYFTTMKRILLIFAQVIFATTEMSHSPILLQFLHSNGFISPLDDIKLYLRSPSIYRPDSQLVQILTKAQENTQLIVPKGSLDSPTHKYELNSPELMCFRGVLESVNTLNLHQACFLKKYNDAESNYIKYHSRIFWTKKGIDFLLSIKPSKDKALNIVLQSLDGKVSELLLEFDTMHSIALPYSDQIMNAYKKVSPPAPLPSFDPEFAAANPPAAPKVHLSLLSQMYRRKFCDREFYTTCKNNYSIFYELFLKSKGEKCITLNLNCSQASDDVVKEVFASIANRWIHCCFLGMRIKRAMPSPSKSALGPGLIESFSMEVNALRELVETLDDAGRYYALEFSCTHLDYLIECLTLAVDQGFLNAQHHEKCIELITEHRKLATKMIDNLKGIHPSIPQIADQQAANEYLLTTPALFF